ncbi:unnamed protein product [Schistosoma curassoni]|uniref:Myotubularin phosphatase domain-containing protein n=1 Tax=Schistosoma curassoni TaxID=6186 RepID=A0A183L775_9TREM|nr:unnamed protein product [Schistosoma curassoni]
MKVFQFIDSLKEIMNFNVNYNHYWNNDSHSYNNNDNNNNTNSNNNNADWEIFHIERYKFLWDICITKTVI